MKIVIDKNYTNKVVTDIPVPCFWKDESLAGWKAYCAVLDEKTFVEVNITPSRTIIENGTTDFFKSNIIKAFESFDLCTEEEFMSQFEKAYKSISLKPELV